LGDRETALKILEEAISLNPSYASAWHNKGEILHELGRDEEAVQCYDRSIAINPPMPLLAISWYNKAFALAVLAKREEMLQALREGVKLDPKLR
jgi:tetratricopeptide (TPR) repeat protein